MPAPVKTVSGRKIRQGSVSGKLWEERALTPVNADPYEQAVDFVSGQKHSASVFVIKGRHIHNQRGILRDA